MVITKEETFGRVAPLYRFKTDDEAIKMGNDTDFGLAAYFYRRAIVREASKYGIEEFLKAKYLCMRGIDR